MPPARNKTARTFIPGFLTLFGLPFFAAGMFLGYLYFSSLIRWSAGRNWVDTPCRIESVESKGGKSSRTVATYTYRYEGRDHTGDRVSFWGGGDNIGSFQRDAYRELEAHRNKEFRCYVNPANPSQSVLYPTLRWELVAFMAIFALTFPAVGAALVFGGIVSTARAVKEARLRDQSPDEPWKWKTAWTQPAIPEDATPWKAGIHLYTLWSGLVVFSMLAAMAADRAFGRGNSWVALIFPLLWCLPAGFSLKRLRHLRAVGRTRLDLPERPVRSAGTLHGSLLLERPLPQRAAVDFTLVCEKSSRRRDSDGDMSTFTEKIWSHQESVTADQLQHNVSGFRLPVGFSLPSHVPETSRDPAGWPQYAWKLKFAVPGTAIGAQFTIPVFQTGDPSVPTPAIPEPAVAPANIAAQLREARIVADFAPDGLPVSLVCPPFRQRQGILVVGAVAVVWTTISLLIVSKPGSPPASFLFPAFAIPLWASLIWMTLHQRTAGFSDSGLEIRNRLGPVMWKSVFPREQILGFHHDTNLTIGSQAYYRVRVESVTGRKTTVADAIPGEALAAALKERLDGWKLKSS